MLKPIYLAASLALLVCLGCAKESTHNISEKKAKYAVFQGTKYFVDELNEVYELLSLSEHSEKFEEAYAQYQEGHGFYNPSRITNFKEHEHSKQQKVYESRDDYLTGILMFPIKDSIEKDIHWNLLIDQQSTDTLISMELKLHVAYSKYMGGEHALLWKIDYEVKFNQHMMDSSFYQFTKEDFLESIDDNSPGASVRHDCKVWVRHRFSAWEGEEALINYGFNHWIDLKTFSYDIHPDFEESFQNLFNKYGRVRISHTDL